MNRYFIELSFKGTRYHGWQQQPNAVSVQAQIEEALKKLVRENIRITGAGRTDTGVHARHFVAHIDCDHSVLHDRTRFLYKMNALLPSDIAIHDIYPVRSDAHARYSALSRTYEYTISTAKDPFELDFSWNYSVFLDVSAMNHAAGMLLHVTDFTSFSKLHSNVRTNTCHIREAEWNVRGSKLVFRIRADRFLRNMVRALVGTLVDVGRGKISREEFNGILEGRNRNLAGVSAPAEGLALVAIEYPQDIRI
jgi:tRNA pseudouridine38-40 synthase